LKDAERDLSNYADFELSEHEENNSQPSKE
jgi:hypothetical protein